MLSRGHYVHQFPDVLDQAIAEHQGLAVLVLAQAFADTLDRLAQALVEIVLRIVETGPDLLLDIPPDPLGLALGQIGHEVARVGDRDDAVANGELALERLRAGIVLQAEQPAEVEAGLVYVIVVVLDKAGALADHALDQCVQSGGIAVVIGNGEQAPALVVPGQGIGIVDWSLHCSWSRPVLRRPAWAGGACCNARHWCRRRDGWRPVGWPGGRRACRTSC